MAKHLIPILLLILAAALGGVGCTEHNATAPSGETAVKGTAESVICASTRVDVRNSTSYRLLVELPAWGQAQWLEPGEWFITRIDGVNHVRVRARYQAYTTERVLDTNSNCNARARIVRLSPGIIRIEPI